MEKGKGERRQEPECRKGQMTKGSGKEDDEN